MKEFLELIRDREVRQLITFLSILILIVSLLVLVVFLKLEIQTLLYAICFLSALLVIMVISGNIEINIGSLFKIKKDTEEIKKEIASLRILFKATQNQTNSPTFNVNLTGGNDVVTKYYEPSDESLDIEDADENVFHNTTASSDIKIN